MNHNLYIKFGDQDKGYRLFQKIIIYLTYIALLSGVYGCSTKTPIPGRKNEDVLETTEISRNIAAFHINSLEIDEKYLYINSSAEYDIKYRGQKTWNEETEVKSRDFFAIAVLCPLTIVFSPLYLITGTIGLVGMTCSGMPITTIERKEKFGDIGEQTKRKMIPYSGFVNIFGERNSNYTTTSKNGFSFVSLSQLPSGGRILIEIKNNGKQTGKEISINTINTHVQKLISINAERRWRRERVDASSLRTAREMCVFFCEDDNHLKCDRQCEEKYSTRPLDRVKID